MKFISQSRQPRQSLQGLIRRAESGDDTSFEFTTAIIPLMLMVCLIAFATVIRSAQTPAWTAASECARASIATLNQGIGQTQGEEAGMNSLRGNHLSTAGATVNVTYGTWDRGTEVTCRVNYNIDVSGIILIENLLPGNRLPMNAQVTLRVEKYKSRWG